MSESNGYIWNADDVLKYLVEERGRSMVVFMNGLWTDPSGFKDQRDAVKQHLNLTDWSYKATGYESSFKSFKETDPLIGEEFDAEFKAVYNPSKGEEQKESPAYSNFARVLAKDLFGYSLEQYRNKGLDTNDETYKHIKKNLVDEAYHFSWFGGLPKVFTQGENDRNRIAKFLAEHGDLDGFAERIKYSDDPPSDLIEALNQFFSDRSSSVSQKINDKWMGEALEWLKSPNNSLILVGHSQGNFFFEDALMQSEFGKVDGSRIRVLSLGSPTDYSAVATYGSLTGGFVTNFKNIDDPVTELQFSVGTTNEKKVVTALAALNVSNILGNLDKHNLSGGDYGYIEKSEVKTEFRNFFYGLHEKGYYFPNGPVEQTEGTENGDWLEGSDNKNDELRGWGRNDVLRGKGGNDKLAGDAGHDFLDGGSGIDTADYGNVPEDGIIVHTEYLEKANSYIYRVEDIDGYEDVLVDIEKISGSNYTDAMYGGNGKDIFYGQGDQDYFEGKGGDDEFYAGTGNDKAYGGDGND
ncbi:MAG TPA: calcium-binding protein, partial [Coleofasciculaceae cyanobacterium]